MNEEFPLLSPLPFFEVSTECFYLPQDKHSALSNSLYLLPDTSPLTEEDHFASVHMGWNQEGLHFFIKVDVAFQEVFYPDISRGDAVELFINTRPVKNPSGFNTPFCHHFFFLPKEYEGIKAGEITKFRRDEPRELASAKDLHSETEFARSHYRLKIFIPSHALQGYDPEQQKQLAFSYRIHRYGSPPQHYNVSGEEFAIEYHAFLWGPLTLVELPASGATKKKL
jgi:hypothetical protein